MLIDHHPRAESIARVLFKVEPPAFRAGLSDGRMLTDSECDQIGRMLVRDHAFAAAQPTAAQA